MAPRNPSELQRLEEERQDLLRQRADIQRILLTGKVPSSVYDFYPQIQDKGTKGIKEALLMELRQIEKELGIEGVNYNSTAFAEQFQ